MNLRKLDPKIIKKIEELSDELYGENKLGNKSRFIRDAVLYISQNKADFEYYINHRNMSVLDAIKKLEEGF